VKHVNGSVDVAYYDARCPGCGTLLFRQSRPEEVVLTEIKCRKCHEIIVVRHPFEGSALPMAVAE